MKTGTDTSWIGACWICCNVINLCNAGSGVVARGRVDVCGEFRLKKASAILRRGEGKEENLTTKHTKYTEKREQNLSQCSQRGAVKAGEDRPRTLEGEAVPSRHQHGMFRRVKPAAHHRFALQFYGNFNVGIVAMPQCCCGRIRPGPSRSSSSTAASISCVLRLMFSMFTRSNTSPGR